TNTLGMSAGTSFPAVWFLSAVTPLTRRLLVYFASGAYMHLHGTLGGPKTRPRKHRQAQVDGGRVQRIDSAIQIETERLVGVHGTRRGDQHLREVGVDPPVVSLVCVRQRGS